MCSIIKKRLYQVVSLNGLICEEKGGFREGRGCRDQILPLVLMAQTHIKRGNQGMFVAFLDLEKAYDSVNRDMLWCCLEKLGLGGQVIGLLKGLYTHNTLQVRVELQIDE